MDQQEARRRLDAAVAERTRSEAELRSAVLDAHRAGVTVTELAELTGMHRNTVSAWLRTQGPAG